MYEYPPILRGTAEQQLAALRDYLVRLARTSEEARAAAASEEARAALPPSGGESGARTASASGAPASSEASLRSLVVKTADSLERRISETEAGIREDTLALSDFGGYLEQIVSASEQSARGVVERYGFESALAALNAQGEETARALRALNGEIRRGLITDPVSGETQMGIAIAQELRFTGTAVEENGLTYYELAPGQTLGLYTASGWQFWVGGQKRGWFDSADGGLHVVSETVDSQLLLGPWRLSGSGGFGIKALE